MESTNLTGNSDMFFKGIACSEIVEKCDGCGRIITQNDKRFCSVYPTPASKWKKGLCNFATHAKLEVPKEETGKKINPLKAAKRAAKGR